MMKKGLILMLLLWFGDIKAQADYKISGLIYDEYNSPISLATVALYNQSDSALIAGGITDTTGKFEILNSEAGEYWLTISFIAYTSLSMEIILHEKPVIDLGVLVLEQSSIELSEASIVSERIKARQYTDKTVFYMDKKMQKISNAGIDMVKFVPGIQVDLFQNISLEGKQNVLIQVNGVERNTSFLNQIDSDDIDRIEIKTNPGVEYGSEISGVVNVILKKDKHHGVSGHVYAEVPVKLNEVYSFPGASIHYTFDRVNVYSSYNGEFSYFSIEDQNHKTILVPGYQAELSKRQDILQKNWSHQFNLGFDYILNEKNQVNFHGFLNPYSNEHDGKVRMNIMAGNTLLDCWESSKDDKDKNHAAFASIYYKHIFQEPSKELTLDLNYYNFKAQNSTIFSDPDGHEVLENTVRPTSQTFNAHLKLSFPIKQEFKLISGIKESLEILNDANSFNYREKISAAYTSLGYTGKKVQINGGIRIELANLYSGNSVNMTLLSGLPFLNVKFDLSKKSNVKIAYGKSLNRPHIYQLNPHSSFLDPYTTQKGNPALLPAIQQELALDYSVLLDKGFISAGAFCGHSSNILENMTVMNDSFHFETTTQNLGAISQIGIKVLGSLALYKNITFNPYLKVFHVQTRGNGIAKENRIENTNRMAMESGLSLAVLFKHDIALSMKFEYNSPVARMQAYYFEDILYFISLEKSIFEKFKIGITSAIPFKSRFTYQGYEAKGAGFNEYSKSNIIMSAFPIWLNIKYSFASGKKTQRLNSATVFKQEKLKKGF